MNARLITVKCQQHTRKLSTSAVTTYVPRWW